MRVNTRHPCRGAAKNIHTSEKPDEFTYDIYTVHITTTCRHMYDIRTLYEYLLIMRGQDPLVPTPIQGMSNEADLRCPACMIVQVAIDVCTLGCVLELSLAIYCTRLGEAPG